MMDGGLLKFKNGFNYIKTSGLVLSAIGIVIIMLTIAIDVFLRNVFNSSISGNYELIQKYLMPLVVFPAMAITYASGIMPRLGMIVEKFSPKIQYVIHMIISLIDFLIMVLLIYYTWNYAMQALAAKVTFPAGGAMYPLYPILFIVPIGFVLLAIEILLTMMSATKKS